jgi:hypothetical protein
VHPLVERLTSVLPPPGAPPTVPPPWERGAAETGTGFPADYRDFVDLYGGGRIDEELTVFSPTCAAQLPGDGPGGFAGFTAFLLDWVGPVFADLHARRPEENPHPLFPAPGGLLPWGMTQDGDHLFWLTETADPDAWPTAVWLRNAPPDAAWSRADSGMAGLLLSLLAPNGDHSPLRDDLLPPSRRPHRWRRGQDWEHPYF